MTICGICLLKINATTFNLECGHKFHMKCLLYWRKECTKKDEPFICPYCRNLIDWQIETRTLSWVKKIKQILFIRENTVDENMQLQYITEILSCSLHKYGCLHVSKIFGLMFMNKLDELKKDVNNPLLTKTNIDNFMHLIQKYKDKYQIKLS